MQCKQRGFVTVWMLGLCMLVMFFGGISLDLWNGFAHRRQLSAITDAAAVAGASQINLEKYRGEKSVLELDTSAAPERAITYVKTQSARSHINLTNVDAHVEGTNRVIVIAEADVDATFTRLLQRGHKYTIRVTGAASPWEEQ